MGIFDRLVVKKTNPRSARLGSRIAMDLRVNVRSARDGQIHSVYLEDLSTGGARISTPLRLAKSDTLGLVLEPQIGSKVEVLCRIVSIRPRRGELHIDYGLKFVSLRSGEADAIRSYVAGQQRNRMAGSPAFISSRSR
jgi:hypothetical protein